MKKTLILIAASSLIAYACKKDRTCSCSETYTTANAMTPNQAGSVLSPTTITSTSKIEYTRTLPKTGKRVAYNYCTHSFETTVGDKYSIANYDVVPSYTFDTYCELK